MYRHSDGYDLPGANHGGEDREWELFDCETDPLELFNAYADAAYRDVVVEMTPQLEKKIADRGDVSEH